MSQKRNNGMWISRQADGAYGGRMWIVPAAMTFAAAAVLIASAVELTGFADIYTPWVMIAAAACVTVVCGVMTKLNRQKLLYPVILAVLLLLVIFGGKLILNGGCLFWNEMGYAWTAGNGWVIPEVAAAAGAENEALSLFLFSVFLGTVCTAVCWILADLQVYILAIAVLAAVFSGMVLFSMDGTFHCILPCLLTGICLLAAGGDKEHALKGVMGRVILVAVCSILLILAADTAGIRQLTLEMSESARDKLHTLRYETEYTTLPEGSISEYNDGSSQSQPALVVTMEEPEEMYLRGFTGAEYSNGVWMPLDTAVLAENKELLYWLNQNGWNPQMQFSEAAEMTVESGKSENITRKNITIQNVNACSKYMYVPYSFSEKSYLEAKEISSDGIPADGNRTYMYSVVSNGTEQISGVLNKLENSGSEKVEAYRQAEGAYRDFVYANYTEIPEETEKQLQTYWEKISSVEEASAMLHELKEEEENCYQYATVAVMTLRHCGLPARYAEGYIISEEMTEGVEKNTSIQADSGCASAWAEVYHDGIGWIPMDLTPGMEVASSSEDKNKNGDIPEEIPPEEELLQDEPEMTEEPEPDGGYVVAVKKVISLTFLLVIAMILMLAMILAARRYLVLKRRHERWNEENVNDAVAVIFAETEHLLKKLGFDRNNGSMSDILIPVTESLGREYAKSLAKMIEINSRAMFSSRMLDEGERKTAIDFYGDTVECLKADEKWYRKMWMQWVLCLY